MLTESEASTQAEWRYRDVLRQNFSNHRFSSILHRFVPFNELLPVLVSVVM